MDAVYDKIGEGYSIGRKTDPKISSFLNQFLDGSESILNIGAGAGSYEPIHKNLIAVEPSLEMIRQRPKNSHLVKQAFAEQLPFKDASFSHSMTVLSMHHWSDRNAAFNEIKRVTTNRFIAVTWNPNSEPYCLTKDYFPEIHEIDKSIFPSLDELSNTFAGIKNYPLEIPVGCVDGFTAAYWARTAAYLDSKIRSGMSTFVKINNHDDGLRKLKADLNSGVWQEKNNGIESLSKLDVGYVVAVWDV